MTPRYPLLALGLIVAGCFIAPATAASPLHVLYFTKSSGFEHEVIKRGEHGEPSPSESVLSRLGQQHEITFTFSKDGSLFTPEYLQQFDVVCFYTSGNLERRGTDGNPPMSPAGKQALLDWVRAGGGFMALHAASDTFHTGENVDGNPPAADRAARYRFHGDASDPYVKLLGGEFINHGAQQVATVSVIDPAFPGFEAVGPALQLQEEWYTLKEFSPRLHVLLVMRTAGMRGADYQRPDYPLAWAMPYGKGRVWFNAMGHRQDVWDATFYQAMLVGAFNWTGGRVSADVTPNLAEVAPEAHRLQAAPTLR